MSQDKTDPIIQFMHFDDNNSKDTQRGEPQLFKLSPIVDNIIAKIQNCYLPKENTIGKPPILYKGTMSFKRDRPLKASKYGIRTYELSYSLT
jgi:hypothetical protein